MRRAASSCACRATRWMSIGSRARSLAARRAFRGAKANGVYYGPVYFFRETEPFMTLAIAGPGSDPGGHASRKSICASSGTSSPRSRSAPAASAYVVDRRGRLIAHPDLWPVLRNTDLGSAAAGARRRSRALRRRRAGRSATISTAARVLSTYAPVRPLGWLVFVELPVNEAYASIYALDRPLGAAARRRCSAAPSWRRCCSAAA